MSWSCKADFKLNIYLSDAENFTSLKGILKETRITERRFP